MQTNITPELIRSALQYVPANIARDDWARVGMAIKSEYPDDTGRDLFTEWSATAEGFDTKATRSTWQSLKASGGVGIGTLLRLAKENGYTLTGNQAPSAPTPEASERLARERAARNQVEQDKINAAQARAASEAALLWQQAAPTGTSAYLSRKGVQPHGVRFAPDGRVLVPLRDAAGELWNVQRIAPDKPASGGTDKLFLKGGRKSGLWHELGEFGTAPAVILLGEGYATASSLFEATGRPVACAFDAGNLVHVAKALRTHYPAALLVLCGDDDRQTFAEKGFNPGRDKATAAARAVRGLAVFPVGLPEGGSDFNDLHQAQGLDVVRNIVDTAIQAHQTGHTASQAAQADKAGKASPSKRRKPSGSSDAAIDAYGFAVTDSGVWFSGKDKDGENKQARWMCSRLDVLARTRDTDAGDWGYLLAFADPLGNSKQWAMPAKMLAVDGGEYRGILMAMGLLVSPAPDMRHALTVYIQTRETEEFATCTDRVGWHGDAFVLPRETIGDDGGRIVFQSQNAMENTFRVKGTPEQWRDQVGALCVGNSRMAFAVACAFAGPLLRFAGMESGGFHYRGDSSSGKTTALKLAASVYGGANYLQRWRSTETALAATAAQHSDCLLILDELAQIDPKTAGECAYMLANETGKARATRGGTPKARQVWRLLFLSAGELGLADHMAEGMKRVRTGQETRMADISADAGAKLGAFENLHGFEGGAALSRHLTGRAQAVFGAPGRAWLEWLTRNAGTLKASIRTSSSALAAQLIPENASGQVHRVGARFALVGAAGEMATAAGLTGWPVGEAERAARACFNVWLAERGGKGDGEILAMLRQVRRFLELHGEGRFALWHRQGDDHNAKTLHRAGFRRVFTSDDQPYKTIASSNKDLEPSFSYVLEQGGYTNYYVLAEVFQTEICAGFDYKTVARVLLEHGCLVSTEAGRHSMTTRLPGIGLSRVYCIKSEIFWLDL